MIKSVLNILLLTSILFSSLHADRSQQEKVSIQLKWFYQYQFAGIFMAKEKGFYKEAGLDVTIKERDPKFNNIMQVIQGDSQYGIADAVILRYRAEGQPVKVLATIFQHNAMVLISKKESGILSPYEMRGKKISYQEGLDDSTVSSILSFAGLSKDDYIKMPMDFTHMSFINGDVDIAEAYLSIEPFWLKEKYGIEVNVIDPKNYGIDFYGDLLFTSEEEIKEHPHRVEAFKNATIQGWNYALSHQEEAIDTILKKYNTRHLNKEQLLYEARITENLIAPKFIPLGSIQKERFSILADLYQMHGLSKTKLHRAVETIIYDPTKPAILFQQYIYPVLWGSLLLLLLVALLIFYNRRLSYLVNERTKELEISKHEAELAAESKSAFLANMSHEIRTPMNAILGFVEQLAKNETEPSRQHIFKTIQNSSRTLMSIINDILDISKIESGKMQLELQDCSLREVIEEVVALFEFSGKEKKLLFNVRIEERIPTCTRLDKTRFKQILTNILSNAIKFTQSGDRVNLELSFNPDTQEIEVFIIDSGIGIAKENLEKIFTPFEQEDSSTTRRFGGTGLGLSITKRLLDMMGGNITVASTLGEGSTFYIRLPYISCIENWPAQQSPIPSQNTRKLRGKVLVVEDNKTNQMLLGIILDELGLSYELAQNGQEAIEMFKDKRGYDLILMDENMPVMNGIEAVRHIRALEQEKALKPIPIIAVTANALSGDRARFLNAGMDDYLAKPYTEESIKAILLHYMPR